MSCSIFLTLLVILSYFTSTLALSSLSFSTYLMIGVTKSLMNWRHLDSIMNKSISEVLNTYSLCWSGSPGAVFSKARFSGRCSLWSSGLAGRVVAAVLPAFFLASHPLRIGSFLLGIDNSYDLFVFAMLTALLFFSSSSAKLTPF